MRQFYTWGAIIVEHIPISTMRVWIYIFTKNIKIDHTFWDGLPSRGMIMGPNREVNRRAQIE